MCNENACTFGRLQLPICTTEIDKVIISDELIPFCCLTNTKLFKERGNKYPKAAYVFTLKRLEDLFYEVLAPKCPICVDRLPDKTINETNKHMQEKHNVQFCGLCLTHDHQFYSEFSYYTKQELTMHKEVGEGKNTSHKGHPQCQICWHRFYDKDHLYKHMRKDHLFCHICDRRHDIEAIKNIVSILV